MFQKTRGIVAAGHRQTAEAAKEMLALGGNAFDAAIAGILASFVVESTLTSAAGGGFLLAHTQDSRQLLFDFFCQTPRQKRSPSEVSFYPVHLDFGGEVQTFHIGLGSVAVPGNLAGVLAVHQHLGKLPLKIVAEPAIDYAQRGFRLNRFQNFSFKLLEPILTTAESSKIYAPRGELLKEGQVCTMKDFAATLSWLVEAGIEEFYRGEIAQQLVKFSQEQGGHLTSEDLTNYQVIIREPLTFRYRDYEIATNPPPSSGGILIAFALRLLAAVNLTDITWGSARHRQLLTQVMQLTNQGRKNRYDRYLYQDNIAQQFLDPDHLQSYQQQLNHTINKWGSTTHISAIDREGNAASVTTSSGEGSSFMIPGTGIMLNNMLGEADLNPLGFHNWPCDRRISSMMSPTLILQGKQPVAALGSGGSNRIRTALLQVTSNLIDYGLSIESAVERPRIHWENQILSIEPPVSAEVVTQLQLDPSTQLVLWPEKNMFFGGVHAVQMANGYLDGAGDPRREGVAIAVNQ